MDTTIRPTGNANGKGTATAPAYVHLKVHSAYSLLEGAITIPRLAKLAVTHGFPAVGLTDTGNLFGALEFSDKLAEAGVQPIIGCILQVGFGDKQKRNDFARAGANKLPSQPAGGLALLACDARGYQHLMKLSSCAFFDPDEAEPPHVEIERLHALSAERGTDCTDRRAGRPHRSRFAGGAGRDRAATAAVAGEDFRRSALCGDPAARPGP
jgi:DNA polymerase-3 subunit alpha